MMETTARTNTILEKKLKELEDLVEEFGFDDGDLNAYREIQLRFIFTQILLAAEISSAKYGEEDQARSMKLRHMAKKLTELEEAFNKQMTCPINVDGVVDVDETGSVCSLVSSLPEEIQDASSSEEKIDDSMKRRKIERIKKKRFRGLLSFGIVGFVAGLINLYGYVCDQMKEEGMVLTPT